MLTATYSLVAIANEQSSMRRVLQSLHQGVRNLWNSLHAMEQVHIESAYDSLVEFDQCCRRRKVEQYLIPALRRVTREADVLLDDLEALSLAGRRLLRQVGDQLKNAFDSSSGHTEEVCSSMEQYCHKTLYRLAREEAELFPIAKRAFSVEEWFAIAEKFLSVDGQIYRGRRYSQPGPMFVPHNERRMEMH